MMNDTPRPPYPGLDPDLLRLANMIDRLRQRAEAAEARLKHEQANTETGARLCNEAFAVLTTKVGTLEAKLAEAQRRGDAALADLAGVVRQRDEALRQVQELRTAQQDTHRPSSVRVTVYLAEEDDGLPD